MSFALEILVKRATRLLQSFFLFSPSRRTTRWIFSLAMLCCLVPFACSQAVSSAFVSANEARFSGPPADLHALGSAFSRNSAFTAIELSGKVSRPFNLDPNPTPFVITVERDGTTETRIRENGRDSWERYPAAGSLGTCSSSIDRPDRPTRPTSLRCSSPVSWVLPGVTLQSSDRTAQVRSASQAATAEKPSTSTLTLWIGKASEKALANDPVKRYTARQLTMDPTSQLPVSLRYELAPAGPVAATYSPATVEILYSDYRNISGYNIPFRIDKLLQDQVLSSFTVENVSIR